jgi:MFS family permease
LLVAGWLFALPVPWILAYAPSWNWIIGANILLGLNQGLSWSSTQVMKLDLVKEKARGTAMGLNEFAGYFAVGGITFVAAYVASTYGLRPYPFFLGAAFSVLGLFSSYFFVTDTRKHMSAAAKTAGSKTHIKNIFWGPSLTSRSLGAVTQGGLVNNMNDGMLWGLYPILLASKGFTIAQVGVLTAIYPACWGLGQLFTGRLGDLVPKKHLLFWGLFLQAAAIALLSTGATFSHFIFLSVSLGLGKALVYPNFLAAVAENSHPLQRAHNIGTYRFWRDSGYAIGAVLTGVLADVFNISVAITMVGIITLLSAFTIQLRMRTERRERKGLDGVKENMGIEMSSLSS